MPQRKNRSEDISGLVLAMSKAQGEIKDIAKNRTVTVRPRSGGQEYSFRYATLSAIFDAIRGPMSKNELFYSQTINTDHQGYYILTTTLHWQNQFISSETPIIFNGNSNQEFGSALTYMKRYALAAIMGIAPDEDDDGNIADGNEVQGMAEAVARKVSAPKPAADPISTGAAKEYAKAKAETKPEPPPTMVFDASKIDVPLTEDESGSDWMKWGQSFMSMARLAASASELAELEMNNSVPMKNMGAHAPKLHKNLSAALAKVRAEFKIGGQDA